VTSKNFDELWHSGKELKISFALRKHDLATCFVNGRDVHLSAALCFCPILPRGSPVSARLTPVEVTICEKQLGVIEMVEPFVQSGKIANDKFLSSSASRLSSIPLGTHFNKLISSQDDFVKFLDGDANVKHLHRAVISLPSTVPSPDVARLLGEERTVVLEFFPDALVRMSMEESGGGGSLVICGVDFDLVHAVWASLNRTVSPPKD
jgi:hypothetical protein